MKLTLFSLVLALTFISSVVTSPVVLKSNVASTEASFSFRGSYPTKKTDFNDFDSDRFRNDFSQSFSTTLNDIRSIPETDNKLYRPYYRKYAAFARWMMSTGSWGIVATSGESNSKRMEDNDDGEFNGPFANVVSYADIKGIPYFYLTTLDPTAADASNDPKVSFVISEASFHKGCTSVSAEEPVCAKMTLSGNLVEVKDKNEIISAKTALFWKHPTMALWPSDHEFKPYKLEIQSIFLINFYGGAPYVSVKEYLNEN